MGADLPAHAVELHDLRFVQGGRRSYPWSVCTPVLAIQLQDRSSNPLLLLTYFANFVRSLRNPPIPISPAPSRIIVDASGTAGCSPVVAPIAPVFPLPVPPFRLLEKTSTPKTYPVAFTTGLQFVLHVKLNVTGPATAPPPPCALFSFTPYSKIPRPSMCSLPAVVLSRLKFALSIMKLLKVGIPASSKSMVCRRPVLTNNNGSMRVILIVKVVVPMPSTLTVPID